MSIQTDKIQELVERRAEARMGGGADRIEAQHKKGKLTARERLALLLDEGGIPPTVEGRMKIAEKIYAAADRYGVPRKDIVFIPLGSSR